MNFVREISDGCFRTCHITSIIFHDSITSIGAWAFAVTDLTSIRLPDKITIIRYNLFRECPSLIAVNFSNKTTVIEQQAFQGCLNLALIEFPASLETIGPSAFAVCPKLKIDASKNENVNYVDDMLFTNKKKTLSSYFGTDSNKDLIVPEGLTDVGAGTFMSKKLKSIVFNGATLENINFQAFRSCSLETISLPSSLRYIGQECFANCNNLKTVTFRE